jgi:SAM-dependent methyltransferase
MSNVTLQYEGFCPICQKTTTFRATDNWLRGRLLCLSCPSGSVPRERALTLVLEEKFPNWRELKIHESSPIKRGISEKLKKEAKSLIQTQYYHDLDRGSTEREYRNEDLQKLTFAANTFDLFISLDVMEHIPEPKAAILEIWRTLKPGGAMLCTWPVRKTQVEALERRVTFDPDGAVHHHKEPEYHGNPINDEGSLVTVDYGYDIHKLISQWAPFDVRVYRFSDRTHGILGEYTEVFLAKRIVFAR